MIRGTAVPMGIPLVAEGSMVIFSPRKSVLLFVEASVIGSRIGLAGGAIGPADGDATTEFATGDTESGVVALRFDNARWATMAAMARSATAMAEKAGRRGDRVREDVVTIGICK